MEALNRHINVMNTPDPNRLTGKPGFKNVQYSQKSRSLHKTTNHAHKMELNEKGSIGNLHNREMENTVTEENFTVPVLAPGPEPKERDPLRGISSVPNNPASSNSFKKMMAGLTELCGITGGIIKGWIAGCAATMHTYQKKNEHIELLWPTSKDQMTPAVTLRLYTFNSQSNAGAVADACACSTVDTSITGNDKVGSDAIITSWFFLITFEETYWLYVGQGICVVLSKDQGKEIAFSPWLSNLKVIIDSSRFSQVWPPKLPANQADSELGLRATWKYKLRVKMETLRNY
ncbi:hypothetical protein OG21DRAFT_1525044 [Imleria badia]|nr:hypothetical protein OG21DRAFT_1525044 [Imleria badia]